MPSLASRPAPPCSASGLSLLTPPHYLLLMGTHLMLVPKAIPSPALAGAEKVEALLARSLLADGDKQGESGHRTGSHRWTLEGEGSGDRCRAVRRPHL